MVFATETRWMVVTTMVTTMPNTTHVFPISQCEEGRADIRDPTHTAQQGMDHFSRPLKFTLAPLLPPYRCYPTLQPELRSFFIIEDILFSEY